MTRSGELALLSNPVPWPHGNRVAVSITFDIDVDSILHLAYPDRSHKLIASQSWLRYSRIAVRRILTVFRHYDIRQTFFFPSWCMETYPELVEEILADGHEIAHHGYVHESPNETQSREEEHHWLGRGIETIEQMTGRRPRGWRAPLYAFSDHSTDLLIEEGFLYDASLMGDDVPYVLQGSGGEVIELPSHWTMDDWAQYTYAPEFGVRMPIKAPADAMKVWLAEFDAAWKYGSMWISVWHPSVSGRLSRCDEIARMIETMLGRGDVWFATMEDIAAHIQTCRETGTFEPAVEPMPTYANPPSLERFGEQG